MVKHLINKLKKGICTLLTIGVLSGCPNPYTIPGCRPSKTLEPPSTEKPDDTETPSPGATPTSCQDYVNLVGKLEDNETHTGYKGILRFYDTRIEDEEATACEIKYFYEDYLGERTTDNSGNFSFALSKEVNPSDKIYCQAVIGNDWENENSYIRTIELLAEDNPNVLIRAVPYNSDLDNNSYFDIDKNQDGIISRQEKEDFKEFCGRLSFYSDPERNKREIGGSLNSNPFHGLKKVSFGLGLKEDFKGFEVNSDEYTEEEYLDIKNKGNNIGFVKELNFAYGNMQQHSTGWFAIRRSEQGYGPYATVYDDNLNGYINWGEVHLNNLAQEILCHELAHILGFIGHVSSATTPPIEDSVMVYSGLVLDTYTVADTKCWKVLYEDTYPGMEPLENVLGLKIQN